MPVKKNNLFPKRRDTSDAKYANGCFKFIWYLLLIFVIPYQLVVIITMDWGKIGTVNFNTMISSFLCCVILIPGYMLARIIFKFGVIIFNKYRSWVHVIQGDFSSVFNRLKGNNIEKESDTSSKKEQ